MATIVVTMPHRGHCRAGENTEKGNQDGEGMESCTKRKGCRDWGGGLFGIWLGVEATCASEDRAMGDILVHCR